MYDGNLRAAFAGHPPPLSTGTRGRPGVPTLAPTLRDAYPQRMSDTPTAVDRVDAAIARIEAAIARRAEHGDALARRHDALKARMAEAVSALDEVIARGSTR